MRKAVVVIADDEPLARKALRGHLASLDWIGEVHEAGDGWSAIRAVDEVRPHILFLDVVMPGVSGVEVAEQIAHRPYIIFTTAFERFAVTAFEIGALDFLLKPFGRDRVRAAAERARNAIAHGMPSVVARAREALLAAKPITRVFVRERGRMVSVPLEDVERLEACDDYVALHAGGRQHLVHARLQDLEARLDTRRFVRLDRVVAVLKSGARIVASRPGTARLKSRT